MKTGGRMYEFYPPAEIVIYSDPGDCKPTEPGVDGETSQFVAELPTYPSAVIYSERSLSPVAPGVREVRCRDPQAAYRFRYDGLKLVPQSGDQYLLLPEKWTPTNGVAILMPRGDTVRLEFRLASSRGNSPRSTC